jgi:hypothetical protein
VICVYALIASSSSRVLVTGITGERLRPVTAGRVTAVVGELRRAPKPTMRQLRRYSEVIEAVAERAVAILPVRFGTCMTDLDELTLALRSRQDTLSRRLRAVRGRAQMTIRLVLESPGSDPGDDPSLGSDPGDDATHGTRYLQQRAASAAQGREIPGFEPIRTAAKRWIREERIEKRAGVATVNHLIPRSSVVAYRAAVEGAADRAAVRVIVSGPHAPYAFADNW